MSILDDIKNIEGLVESLEEVRKPEDLQNIIQNGKDIFDKNIDAVKNIPSELERWQDMAKDLGILSENTDLVAGAKDILFRNAVDLTKGTFLEGKLGLENLLSVNGSLLNKELSYFSIGGVKIDFVYNPNPRYETNAVSQPIISSTDIDRVSEDAENQNPTLSVRCVLKGEDRETRFEELNRLRETKTLNQVILNKTYDRMLITRLKPSYANTNDLEFTIEFENIFVAQLKRAAAKKAASNKAAATKGGNLAKTSVKANPKTAFDTISNNPTLAKITNMPIPEEQTPLPTLRDFVKEPMQNKIGFVTPLSYKSYDDYKENFLNKTSIGVIK